MKEYKFVGFWQRVVMYLMDLIIISGIIFLISQIFNVKYSSQEDIGFLVSFIVNIGLIIPAVYTLLFWKLKGATPGKLIRRVKIVDAKTGKIPKLWRLILRYLCYPISKSLLFFGFFWIGIDSRKQSWHDKISRTVVIKPNIIKIPKDADYDYQIPESESLFPTYPSNSDTKKWRIGKILMILSFISIIAISWMLGDEPLFPEAENWLYEPAFVENNPEDNGFYSLIGVGVPEEQDNFIAGYNWIQSQNNYILKYAQDSSVEYNVDEIERTLTEIDIKSMTHFLNNDSLFTYCLEKKDDITKLYIEHSYINERFSNAVNQKYFKTTIIPHYARRSPIFMNLVRYKLLENYYIALLYSNGERKQALNLLEQSMQYSRKLSELADDLILKLVASILIERNLITYNQLLNFEKNNYLSLKTSISKIKLINNSERDMTVIVKRMFIGTNSQFLDMFNFHQNLFVNKNHFITKDFVANSESIVFKPHKTINQDYLTKSYLAKLSLVNGIEFSKIEKRPYVFEPSALDYLSNFMGSILVSIAVPIYHKYIATFHNIDGYVNMLKLKMMIIEQDLTSDQIPDLLESQKDLLSNPYTGDSFKWDAKNSTIYFECPYQDDNNLREIKINL